jgi:two-component system, chemotaxis family, CheB/CheR fusion protein
MGDAYGLGLAQEKVQHPLMSDQDSDPPMTRIVGLGASAGGLEALGQFLGQVPPDSGLAYLVVQHLDPTHKAMLVELLQRVCVIPVREATSAAWVAPNFVYVIAPNSELTVSGGRLQLRRPDEPRGLRLPIDVLFSSLAREQGDLAIGVVMSGMGSDGTHGLQAIRGQGGLTLAQQPESAQFDSMPRNAIGAGACDIVATPAELPQHIFKFIATQRLKAELPVDNSADAAQSLANILRLLREHGKQDLTQYKPSTLKRRSERRMGVHGLPSLTAYEAFLRENPQELDLLFKEMLIGVTSFFRDPPVWKALTETVLPALLSRREQDVPLRAWVVGCSTGEEAYSLAMVFREVIEALPQPSNWSLQIFATDLSAEAIAIARRGCYARSIGGDVSPERLQRFFSVEGDGYQAKQNIREMVLFTRHNVILDPPFTRLDLLSCRNLMIYFTAPLQQRLLPLFHYALRPGSVLLLGESETVGRSLDLFSPLDGLSRLYLRSAGSAVAGSVDFPIQRGLTLRTSLQELKLTTPLTHLNNLQGLADQLLLQHFSPPAVLVNEHGDIIYISGHTGRYLEPAAGRANWNVHVMAHEAIRTQLVAALRQALREKSSVELHGLKVGESSHDTVDIVVKAVQEPKLLNGMALIVFREVAPSPQRKAQRRLPVGAVDPMLTDELVRSQDELRALRQEMRASAEELQAANEELQSTNEELQAANEELTTSKEESQSMNEELQTINAELQVKLDDLALAQSDMQNLLNSTDIATLFLDNALNVRRFTEHMKRIVHLRDGDIGRPLSDLASTLIYPQLHEDAKETLRTLVFCEKQIPTTDGHWLSVRIMPYRTLANVIQGAVITFIDITAAKNLEGRLRKSEPGAVG